MASIFYTTSILPTSATNKTVTWSVTEVTGEITTKATINAATGEFTPLELGQVKIIATATDGSGVTGEKTITIVEPTVLVTSIVIEGPDTVTLE